MYRRLRHSARHTRPWTPSSQLPGPRGACRRLLSPGCYLFAPLALRKVCSRCDTFSPPRSADTPTCPPRPPSWHVSGAASRRRYRLGVGVGLGAGVGVASSGEGEGAGELAFTGEGEGTGDLAGAGEGDGLAFAVVCFVLARCLEEPAVPAFSIVFPVFFNPLPTVRSVACAPCSIVWPVFFAAFSTV